MGGWPLDAGWYGGGVAPEAGAGGVGGFCGTGDSVKVPAGRMEPAAQEQ